MYSIAWLWIFPHKSEKTCSSPCRSEVSLQYSSQHYPSQAWAVRAPCVVSLISDRLHVRLIRVSVFTFSSSLRCLCGSLVFSLSPGAPHTRLTFAFGEHLMASLWLFKFLFVFVSLPSHPLGTVLCWPQWWLMFDWRLRFLGNFSSLCVRFLSSMWMCKKVVDNRQNRNQAKLFYKYLFLIIEVKIKNPFYYFECYLCRPIIGLWVPTS